MGKRKIEDWGLLRQTTVQLKKGAADDNVWLEGDLVLLSQCDAVLMVEGWEKSGSARTERDFAINSDIPVYTSYDGILNFLKRE